MRLPICLTRRGSFIAAPATCSTKPEDLGGAVAVGMLRQGSAPGPHAAIAARPSVVTERAVDGRKTIVDRAPDRDLAVRLEQGVQIVLEIGQQESADAGRLEQPHVSGLLPGHVDVRIERDAASAAAPDTCRRPRPRPESSGAAARRRAASAAGCRTVSDRNVRQRPPAAQSAAGDPATPCRQRKRRCPAPALRGNVSRMAGSNAR